MISAMANNRVNLTAGARPSWYAAGGSLFVAEIMVVNWRDLALVAVFGATPWILFTIAGAYAIVKLNRTFLRVLVALLTIVLAEIAWLAASPSTRVTILPDKIWFHPFLVGAVTAWLVSYCLLVRMVFRRPLSNGTAGEPVRNEDVT